MNRLLTLTLLIFFSFTLTAQEIIRGPYLQSNGPESIIVKWRTDIRTQSKVSIGKSSVQLGTIFETDEEVTDHEVLLKNLNPSTKYYYAVGNDTLQLAGADSEHYFNTSPEVGDSKPTKVWVLGDCGTGNDDQRNVRDAYYDYDRNEETDLILLLGDNAYQDGKDWEYQDAIFEDMYEDILLHAPMWSCLGNHDLRASSAVEEDGPYYDIFAFPKNGELGGVASGTESYYSFDYGNIHFITLNSQGPGNEPGDPMLLWLEEDLNDTDQDWIITIFHYPPYSKGSHDSDKAGSSIDMREHVLPILEAGGVDLVLSGHSHSYERSYLLHGHYDYSDSLKQEMILDNGDGRRDGDGNYSKTKEGADKGKGAVYVVSGSAGKTSSGDLNHPVMYYSAKELGSVALEINGDQLDLKFIDDVGDVKDYFSLNKSGLANGNAPVVNLDELEKESIIVGDMIRLMAEAEDTDGAVTKVEFYANGIYIGTDYEAPYELDWTTMLAGFYNIYAKANDDEGLTSTSNTIDITVDNLPEPLDLQVVYCPEDIELNCLDTNGMSAVWEAPQFITLCNPPKEPSCEAPQIQDMTYIGSWEESHYYESDKAMKWKDARDFCFENGGSLAVISSQEENDTIQQLMDIDKAWIGFSDEFLETFQWVDSSSVAFQNWYSNEPTADDNEHYVRINKSTGEWQDKSNYAQPFLMEFVCPIDTLPPVDTLVVTQITGFESGAFFGEGTSNRITYQAVDICGDTLDCSFTVSVNVCAVTPPPPPPLPICHQEEIENFDWIATNENAVYYLSKSKYTWQEADELSRAMEGHLVKIDSLEENDFLEEALDVNDYVIIGINDMLNEDEYTWADSTLAAFTNFKPYFDNRSVKDFGLMSPWTGEWKLDDQFVKKRFVLEIPCMNLTEPATLQKQDNLPQTLGHTLAEKVEEAQSVFKIYPNPISDILNMNFVTKDAFQNGKLIIFKSDGTLVLEQKLSLEKGANTLEISSHDWAKGIYFVKGILQNEIIQGRFIKQ